MTSSNGPFRDEQRAQRNEDRVRLRWHASLAAWFRHYAGVRVVVYWLAAFWITAAVTAWARIAPLKADAVDSVFVISMSFTGFSAFIGTILEFARSALGGSRDG